jgi:hypothetical protein
MRWLQRIESKEDGAPKAMSALSDKRDQIARNDLQVKNKIVDALYMVVEMD